jgi:hypothetical protein
MAHMTSGERSMATQKQKQVQQYKAMMLKVVSSPEFVDGLMEMMDEIRSNVNPDDVVTPFFTQAELRSIGDFYTDQVVMGEILSCSINRLGKLLIQQVGMNLFDPPVLASMIRVKEELKIVEKKARDRMIALSIKRYGEPKNINEAARQRLVDRMYAAEAQFEKDVDGKKPH